MPNSKLRDVFISPLDVSRTSRSEPFINAWRLKDETQWLVNSYRQTPGNRRRAAQLQAALSERETRQAAEAA